MSICQPHHPPSDGGFTLLETLVALTILGLSVSVVFGIFSGGIERALQDRAEMQGRVLAQGLLATAVTTPRPVASTGDSGGFHWRLDVTPGAATSNPNLIPERIGVSVLWHAGAYERSLQLQTLVLTPPERVR